MNILQTLNNNKNTLETADFVPSLLEIDAKLVNLLLVIALLLIFIAFSVEWTYCNKTME